MGDHAGVPGDAEQMFVEGLIELAGLAVGIGEQRIGRVEVGARRWIGEAGVVVIGQHQGEAAEMHDVRVLQPVSRVGTLHDRQHAACHARGALFPCGGRDR